MYFQALHWVLDVFKMSSVLQKLINFYELCLLKYSEVAPSKIFLTTYYDFVSTLIIN